MLEGGQHASEDYCGLTREHESEKETRLPETQSPHDQIRRQPVQTEGSVQQRAHDRLRLRTAEV